MGCSLLRKNSDSKWLKYSRKHVYMHHRKILAPTHSYLLKKYLFDGKTKHERNSRRLTGHNISQNLKHFKNVFGNVNRSVKKTKRAYWVESDSDSKDVSSESEEEEEVELDHK